MSKFIPSFKIEVVEHEQAPSESWPYVSKELQDDAREVYDIDAQGLQEALNKYSMKARTFNILLDRSKNNGIS